MLTVHRGKIIIQLPCGCNSRKFAIIDPVEDMEKYKQDLAEVEDFVENHKDYCWSK